MTFKICYWCDKEIEGKVHIDHIIPKVIGKNNQDNLIISCAGCNLSKNKNIWIKTKNGVEKYNKPKKFVYKTETETSKKVIVSTVYTIKKGRKRPKKNEYDVFGVELIGRIEKILEEL